MLDDFTRPIDKEVSMDMITEKLINFNFEKSAVKKDKLVEEPIKNNIGVRVVIDPCKNRPAANIVVQENLDSCAGAREEKPVPAGNVPFAAKEKLMLPATRSMSSVGDAFHVYML